MRKIKNHRRPIQITMNGKSVTFVTIGFCAAALGRTTTSLKRWEGMGLFPPAPYRLVRGQLRVYPEDFLQSITEIESSWE